MAGAALATVVAVALWIGTRSRSELASWLVQPIMLQAAIGVSLGTMVLRALVAIDAMRSADRQATARLSGQSMVGLAVVATLIPAPHLMAVSYLSAQLDLVTTVFATEQTTTAQPTPLPEAPVPELPTPPGSPSSVPTSLDSVPATIIPSTEVLQTWDGEERLSIALLGGDGGFDRVGVRTDTIIVLSIDIETGDAVAFSVPRNWQAIRFPDGTPAAAAYPDGYDEKANAVYALGTKRPELFPGSNDPAGDAIKQALAQVLGIPIQYYVLVDMVAVVDTIDLFGGLDLTVTEHINDTIKPIVPGGPPLVIDTEPGEQHFDGLTTLAYVRSRRQSWDYNRMARQRCVVAAMIDQVSVLDVVKGFRPLTAIISEHVLTDIPLDRSDDLIKIAERLDPQRITTLSFVPPDYPQHEIPFARVREDVAQALIPTTEEPSAPLSTVCNMETEHD
jgi:LCP family protein required for cell wall assembly